MTPAPHLPLRLALVLSLLSPIQRLDEQVQRAVQDARRPGLEAPMRAATGSRQTSWIIAGVLVLALGVGPAGPGTARVALGVLAPVNAVVEGLKWSVNRPRPDGDRRRANSSFPSSHAANAAAVAWILGARWRRLAPAFWLLAALVIFSRMYLNRHFLSDVLCGVIIGVGIGWWILKWFRARGWAWPSGDRT